MAGVGGYIVRLRPERYQMLINSPSGTFAEPVQEFVHSRNISLLCLIIDPENQITHLGLGKRGSRAGTALRRLNIAELFKLPFAIPSASVLQQTNNRFRQRLTSKFSQGGYILTKTLQELVDVLVALRPEISSHTQNFLKSRQEHIAGLPEPVRNNLAQQKEAVATALTIAGIERAELSSWEVTDKAPDSYLDGLRQARVREDSILANDLVNFPGKELLKTLPVGAAIFENEDSKITVLLTNRQPLESQVGVDLIYFNETFSCFVMVQYKMMESEGNTASFRIPNTQFAEEVSRMDKMLSELSKVTSRSHPDGFRFSENPFFLKFCPRLIFDPDNTGLVKGMYLPLKYWKALSTGDYLDGPRGGKRLTYDNVRRHMNNTEFASLVSNAWVGTNIEQSKEIEILIQNSIEQGRAVIFAIESDKKPIEPLQLELDSPD